MILAYKKINEGNGIYIKSDPVIGIVALTSFTESTTGITLPSFFVSKVFRFTKDGINFSEWQELTIPNIAALSFLGNDEVIIELQFLKNNPDPLLDVVSVEFTETSGSTGFDETYFSKSIFSEFFGSADLEVLRWYLNIVEKLYRKGLVPSFVERENELNTDQDYLNFWKSISKYFAFLVIYARKYEKFYETEGLLQEYLEQRGLKTSNENNLLELNYLMNKFQHQIFNRGTIHIIDDKVLKGDEIDGELLRLIFYRSTNEFLFNLHKVEHFGWNVNNSSPLWRGLYLNKNLQKVTQSSQVTKVSTSIAYEVSFWLQTDKQFEVIVEAFDLNGTLVKLKNAADGSLTNTSIASTTLMRSDKRIFVRICIFPISRTIDANDLTNINQGNNLIMTSNVVSIKPRIFIDSVEVILNDDNIDSFRIAPLFTNYSHGILQVYNWISCWLQNNNKSLSKHQVKQFIRRYLIPYNSHLEFLDILVDDIWDGQGEQVVTTTTTRQLAWRGVDPSCIYEEEVVEVEWRPEGESCEQDGNNPPNLIWVGDESTAQCI